MFLQSDILARVGVPHAFTTRRGGVSSPPFDSLNFGNPGELPANIPRDPKANIERNFRLVLLGLACEARRLEQVHQVHGPGVVVFRRDDDQRDALTNTVGDTPSEINWGDTKADAIVTDDPTRTVAVRVSDCCPILLASSDGRVVAAVHAGWRGVISGVAQAAIVAMKQLGATSILAAIGPCISVDHFEVGPEVADEFRRTFGSGTSIVRCGVGDRSFVDLKESLRAQLRGCGIIAIDVLPHCTVRDADLFFSHRREQGVTGRMIGVIGPRS